MLDYERMMIVGGNGAFHKNAEVLSIEGNITKVPDMPRGHSGYHRVAVNYIYYSQKEQEQKN